MSHRNFGLDHGVGHPVLFGLAHGSLQWPERRWRYLHGSQERIDRGFCPKNRSTAVVPSAQVRQKL
jgi:hypothetical protein